MRHRLRAALVLGFMMLGNLGGAPASGCILSLTVNITFPSEDDVFKQGLDVIVKGTVLGGTNPTAIQISVDGSIKGECYADANGNWKFQSWDTTVSVRGTHAIRAYAKDSLDREG